MGISGILLIDKEEDWTSQDVVSKLRGILGEKRIGHAGTLDPLATGLLVVLVGRPSRAASYAEASVKEYTASIRLGISTDTQDITGTVIAESNIPIPTEADFLTALPHFIGEIHQLPPMYSAIKIHGQKLYNIARRGETIDRPLRAITIYSIDYLGRNALGDYCIRVRCSKGTYIRTLCNDIGDYLGCGACMVSLRRKKCGSYSVENAKKIGQITRDDIHSMIPIDSLFSDLPSISLNQKQEKLLRCGNSFRLSVEDGEYRFYSSDDIFLGIGMVQNQLATTEKSFFEVNP